MLSENASLERQLQSDRTFLPPYCPNSNCKYHRIKNEPFWSKYGTRRIRRFPYCGVRYICKHCGKTFGSSFFRLDYRQRVWGLNEKIFREHRKGVSMRETGREVDKDESFVRYRLKRMARFALLKHVELSGSIKIEEPIVYDGLENFAYSQFDPNNINHAVGKSSLFIYDFNFAPLNRKGMMSPWQKRKKRLLEEEHGHYPRDAIRTKSREIFARLLARSAKPKLTLHTDRHFQYCRAIQWDLDKSKFEHLRTSSKISRNFHNPLFAVNNIDLQARHNLSAFKRETIAFSKHSVAMQESFLLYSVYRNYMRPMYWGTHRSDPECARVSPAMRL